MTFSGEHETVGRKKPRWTRARKPHERIVRTTLGRARRLERQRADILDWWARR